MRTCTFSGCDRKHEAHGLCKPHYRQAQRGNQLKPILVVKDYCSIIQCSKTHKAKGYCAKHYKILSVYGISPGVYEDMLRDQDNKCRICKQHKPLVVDHDHNTGEVRGLLCHLCNRAIGFLQDDFDIVTSAAKYLKEWKEE